MMQVVCSDSFLSRKNRHFHLDAVCGKSKKGVFFNKITRLVCKQIDVTFRVQRTFFSDSSHLTIAGMEDPVRSFNATMADLIASIVRFDRFRHFLRFCTVVLVLLYLYKYEPMLFILLPTLWRYFVPENLFIDMYCCWPWCQYRRDFLVPTWLVSFYADFESFATFQK